jgi:hypothetical protein
VLLLVQISLVIIDYYFQVFDLLLLVLYNFRFFALDRSTLKHRRHRRKSFGGCPKRTVPTLTTDKLLMDIFHLLAMLTQLFVHSILELSLTFRQFSILLVSHSLLDLV